MSMIQTQLVDSIAKRLAAEYARTVQTAATKFDDFMPTQPPLQGYRHGEGDLGDVAWHSDPVAQAASATGAIRFNGLTAGEHRARVRELPPLD